MLAIIFFDSWGISFLLHFFSSPSLHSFILKIYISESKHFLLEFLSHEVLLKKKGKWNDLFCLFCLCPIGMYESNNI